MTQVWKGSDRGQLSHSKRKNATIFISRLTLRRSASIWVLGTVTPCCTQAPQALVRIVTVLSLLFFMQPCQGKESLSADLKLDPALLRQWNAKAKLPCSAPFRATYRKNGKELTFLAVNHMSGPVDPSNSELSLVSQEIERTRPSGLVVETNSDGNVFPKENLSSIYENCMQERKFRCGEAAYAALTGGRINASVMGGEPPRQSLNADLERKISREELLALNSSKTVISMKRKGVPPNKWPELFLSEMKKELVPSHQLDGGLRAQFSHK